MTRRSFNPPRHKGKKNKNAATIDFPWLVSWFKEFCAGAGQKKEGVVVTNSVSTENFSIVSSYFTWDRLHQELIKYAEAEFEKQASTEQ